MHDVGVDDGPVRVRSSTAGQALRRRLEALEPGPERDAAGRDLLELLERATRSRRRRHGGR